MHGQKNDMAPVQPSPSFGQQSEQLFFQKVVNTFGCPGALRGEAITKRKREGEVNGSRRELHERRGEGQSE